MKKHSCFYLIFISIFFVSVLSYAFNVNANALLGKWKTADGDAIIEFYKCGNKYCGRIVWAKEPNKKDIHNPNPSLRNRPLLGATILTDFVFNGNNEWIDGRIYDPNNGKKYKCKLTMDSKDRLKVRGYILCSIFGKTTIWKRVNSIPKKIRRERHE